VIKKNCCFSYCYWWWWWLCCCVYFFFEFECIKWWMSFLYSYTLLKKNKMNEFEAMKFEFEFTILFFLFFNFLKKLCLTLFVLLTWQKIK
jgi:hypothetical protein